jgi:hypothetical protein
LVLSFNFVKLCIPNKTFVIPILAIPASLEQHRLASSKIQKRLLLYSQY